MAESITTEVDKIPENVAEAVNSARTKFVPVNTIVVSVWVTESTTGNAALEDCSYWQKDVSVLTQTYVVDPSLIDS